MIIHRTVQKEISDTVNNLYSLRTRQTLSTKRQIKMKFVKKSLKVKDNESQQEYNITIISIRKNSTRKSLK